MSIMLKSLTSLGNVEVGKEIFSNSVFSSSNWSILLADDAELSNSSFSSSSSSGRFLLDTEVDEKVEAVRSVEIDCVRK